MWTQFWDMHSGGGQKEKWARIYIEAPEEEAKVIFYNRFGHNPERVTCTCCGEDYSIDESETFEEISAYHRHCKWTGKGYVEEQDDEMKKYYRLDEWPPEHLKYKTPDEYEGDPEVLVIHADQITDDERCGSVPQQGYVWMD